MAEHIPRGVQVVKWTNDDGSKSVRYRVRIQRKTFKADRLFDELGQAAEFLAASKSGAGRAVLEEEDRKRREIADRLAARTLQFDLRGYMKVWEDEHLPNEEATDKLPYNARKRVKVERSRIKTICSTPVEYNMGRHLSGTYAVMAVWPTEQFGNLKLDDLSARTAQSYIQNRRHNGGKSPVSYATIKRDLAFLSVFFGWLKIRFPDTAKEFEGNPFEDDGIRQIFRRKTVSKELSVSRDVTFETFGGQEAEDRLFEELRKCRNPQMVQIVALALATGQRRGEILELTWDRVFPEHIRLRETDTKTGRAREVYLSEEAKKLLATVDRVPEKTRLFSYTPEGFKSVWDRVRKRAGLQGLRFHDLRHIFVARLVKLVASPVAAASVAGFRSVGHFERAHFKPAKDRQENQGGISTEAGIRRTVGHSDARMTANYAGNVARDVVRAADAARKAPQSGQKRFPVVFSVSDDSVTLYTPDFALAASGATFEEALAALRASAHASGENPSPSKLMDVARENPGAAVKILEILPVEPSPAG